jgi:hypothetical protein
MWPVSFGLAVSSLFHFFSPVLESPVFLVGAVAFWPSYIVFLALAMVTGERKYFAALGVINLIASVCWHIITWNAAVG